jgi:hypothetical protein
VDRGNILSVFQRHLKQERSSKYLWYVSKDNEAITNSLLYHTKLQSEVYRDGEEEATQSYSTIHRGADDDANKGRRMNVAWYQISARLSATAIP